MGLKSIEIVVTVEKKLADKIFGKRLSYGEFEEVVTKIARHFQEDAIPEELKYWAENRPEGGK